MAKKFIIGLEDIKLKIATLNGATYAGSAFSASAGTSIGEVLEGSTSINDEEPSETKYKGDYTDATLMSLFQRGDITMETDIIEVDGAKFAELTGGTWNPTTKKITIPATAPNITGEVELKFDLGIEKFTFPNAQIVANYVGANLKTELFKLHLKVIGLADSNGNVGEITLTE